MVVSWLMIFFPQDKAIIMIGIIIMIVLKAFLFPPSTFTNSFPLRLPSIRASWNF